MTGELFRLSGVAVNWAMLILGVGVLQWLVFLCSSAFARAKFPARGLRPTERRLIAGSCLLLVAAFVALDVPGAGAQPTPETATVRSSRGKGGSCALVDVDMPADKIRKRMGQPDETRPDEEARGPGATTWIYRDARCAIHIFDDKADFID